MKPAGQPPDIRETTAVIHAPDNPNPQPPRRNIAKITRDESNRRFKADCALAVFNYSKGDTKYIHSNITTDTWYWEDDALTCRVYHFNDHSTLKTILTKLDKSKMSSNVEVRLGLDLDKAPQVPASDTRETTTDESEKETDDWQTHKNKRRRKTSATNLDKAPATLENVTVPNQKPTTPDTAENSVRILNHVTKSGNPLYIKSVLNSHSIPLPSKQYYSHKMKVTTLQFGEKHHAILFLEKVSPTIFGDKASYELYKPTRTNTTPRDATQDWNAVIRGVDPDINVDDFNKELTEHGIKFRRTSRITTPNGDKTHMVRIYFDDQDSAKTAIFNGITILGRRFRVEPPRVEARHIPCRKCSQYGHSIKECRNNAVCVRCGGKPGSCTHAPNANIMFCATCGGRDHFTGQVRCRLYPRSSAPPEQPRQMPLPKQTIQSPTRPSATDFPALSQSVWTKNPLTETVTKPTSTQTSTAGERSLTQSIEERLEAAMTKAMQVTMTKLESYIDARLTAALDQMIKFTLTVVNNTVQPTQTKNLQSTANNTAKKLWRKRVQMVPLKNSIDVMISDMKDDLRQDLRSLILNTIAAPTPTDNPV